MSYSPPPANAVNFQPLWEGGYVPPSGGSVQLVFGSAPITGDVAFGVTFDTATDFFFGFRGYLVADLVIDAGPTTYRYVTGDFGVVVDLAATFGMGEVGGVNYDVLLAVSGTGVATPFGNAAVGVPMGAAGLGLLAPVVSGGVSLRIAPKATGEVPPVSFGIAALSALVDVASTGFTGVSALATLQLPLSVQATGNDAVFGAAVVPVIAEVAAAAVRGLAGSAEVPVGISVSGGQSPEHLDTTYVKLRARECVVLQ